LRNILRLRKLSLTQKQKLQRKKERKEEKKNQSIAGRDGGLLEKKRRLALLGWDEGDCSNPPLALFGSLRNIASRKEKM